MTEDQLNTQLADFFGKLTTHIDDELRDLKEELKHDINDVRTTVDGIANRLDADNQERAAIVGELQGHEDWIKQLADATGTQLAIG